jgi:hypothetical protein
MRIEGRQLVKIYQMYDLKDAHYQTNFVNPSPQPNRRPDSRTPSPDCCGMAKAIGIVLTNRLSRTKAQRGRGCTPTCIVKKAIRATPRTGIVAQASLFAGSRWMRNGSAS